MKAIILIDYCLHSLGVNDNIHFKLSIIGIDISMSFMPTSQFLSSYS